jgi:hypothetical protein
VCSSDLDESISQKIKVINVNIEKQIKTKNNKQEIIEIGEYDDELTKQLKLKIIKRSIFGISYEKAKKIIKNKNIKNKEDYYKLCEIDIRLTNEPEVIYKGQFINWIDYLGIERIYYDLETCKIKVNEYLLQYSDIKKYYLDLSIITNELCKIDDLFPPHDLWIEYYDIKNLYEIITFTNTKKKIVI